MKKQIILQQAQQNTLSKKLDQLITNINVKVDITDTLTQKVVQQIKMAFISIAKDNNYWNQIIKLGEEKKSEEKSDQAQSKTNKMIFQSEFLKLYNLIIQQAADPSKTPAADPSKTPAADSQKTNQKDKKDQNQPKPKSNDDTKSKLQAAARDNSSVGDEITLVVTSPEDFEFQNADGQRFESKKSLQRLDGFLKKNVHILQAEIDKNKKQDKDNLNTAINEAILIFEQQILSMNYFSTKNGLYDKNKLITAARTSYNTAWKYVSKQHKFGDRVKNKMQYQKLYFILILSIIIFIALNDFETSTEIFKHGERQLAGMWISKYRLQKKNIFDENVIKKLEKETLPKIPKNYIDVAKKAFELIKGNCNYYKTDYDKFIKDINNNATLICRDLWEFNFKSLYLKDIYKKQVAKITKDLIINQSNTDANISQAAAFLNNSGKGYNTVIDPRSYQKVFKAMSDFINAKKAGSERVQKAEKTFNELKIMERINDICNKIILNRTDINQEEEK